MKTPVVAQNGPYQMKAEKDKTYAWCACGQSKKQPLCDGTHTGTGIKPVLFKTDDNKEVILCGCKHTASPPYCDGSHVKF